MNRPHEEPQDFAEPGEMETLRVGDDGPSAEAASHAAGSSGRGLAPGTVVGERYEILERLGRGALASVYRAADRGLEGRLVALEHFDSPAGRRARFRELFFQEVRAAQNFVSPRVVPVRETGAAEDGSVFLTMDFVEGESLRELLERDRKLTARHALEIARQALLGLQSAHDQGFVHGDVGPDCVLLARGIPRSEENPFGISVRLVDFGLTDLARDVTPVAAPKPVSRYLSPESARGDRIDERADLFAVGAFLFEGVAGEPLVRGTGEEIERTLAGEDLRARVGEVDLPRDVRKLLRRALHPDPTRRVQSATEFVAAIEASPAYRPGRGAPLWLRAAALLLGLAAVAQALWIARGEGALDFLPYGWGTVEAAPAAERAPGGVAGSEAPPAEERIEAAVAAEREALTVRFEAALAERDARVAALTARLDAEPATGGEDAAELRASLDSALAERTDLALELDAARERLADLEAQNARLAAATEPKGRTARAFDGVLERIETSAGRAALAHLDTRVREHGAFGPEGLEGLETVRALARAAAGAEDARDARARGESDPRAIENARAALARARAALKRLPTEAAAWISLPAADGERPDRAARAASAIDALGAELEALHAAAEERRARLWAELQELPFDHPPSRAIDFFDEFGRAGLAEHLDALARPLEESLLVRGHLEPDRLRASGPVRGWGRWLVGPVADVEGEGARTLRLLHAAQLWYAGEPFPRGVALPVPDGRQLPPTPEHDWRIRLALQVALAHENAPFPPPAGTISVHDHRTPSGAFFLVDRAGPEPGSIERRLYAASGLALGAPQSFRLELEDDRLLAAGQLLFDLRDAGEHVRVAAWNDLPVDELPRAEWSRGLAFDDFERELSARPAACLVVEGPGTELWLSPRHGIVRELRSGRFTRRLAYTDVSR